MPTQVLMPQLGESVEEGTITKWLKAPGDQVEEYEPLLEINTDKVDTEIPSPADGVLLEILVSEGTAVKAGELLAWIGAAGETAPDDAASGGAPLEEAPLDGKPALVHGAAAVIEPVSAPVSTSPAPGRDRDLGFISPVVARIAAEHNVDLFQVTGSGRNGRITKKDILAYLENRQTAEPQPASVEAAAPPAPAPTSTPAARPAAPSPAVSATAPSAAPGDVLPLTPVRRLIADHMVRSKHTSPHVTTVMEVDLSRVVAHRQANKAGFARDGAKLTFTAYFVAATVAGVKAFPLVNSSFTDEGIQLHRQINIGMATDLGEAGLIVPVIKNADALSLLGLARTINDLADRARARRLAPDEVQGGTFTITNHGISGSLFATPIINQPQCGILGVGVMQKRVIVISDPELGDTIAIRPMAYLTLTFDHRILDGAIADHFLAEVVNTLQNWS